MPERYERAHVCACACARRHVCACVCVGDQFHFAFLFAWVRACGCVRVCMCACGWGGLQGRRCFGARAGAMDLYDTPRTQRDTPRTQRGKPRILRAISLYHNPRDLPTNSMVVYHEPRGYPLATNSMAVSFSLVASCPPSVILLLVVSFGCSCGVSLTAVEII